MPFISAFATSHAYTFQEPETWDQRRERSQASVARKAGRPAGRYARGARRDARRQPPPLRAHPRGARDHPRAPGAREGRRGAPHRRRPDGELRPGQPAAAPRVHRRGLRRRRLGPQETARVSQPPGGRAQAGRGLPRGRLRRRLLGGVQGRQAPVARARRADPVPRSGKQHAGRAGLRERGASAGAFGGALLRVRAGDARAWSDSRLAGRRIVLCASGGLSHFSPSHPWAHHVGSRYVGDISVEFDRRIVEWMRAGEGTGSPRFPRRELIEHGEAELRQWIVLLGAVGAHEARVPGVRAALSQHHGHGGGLVELDR